ncbi:hypothetical protein [Arthrobacter sp. MAHUQ-56]
MKILNRHRVVAPSDISVDRVKVVLKGDRGIVVAERGNDRNKMYDVVFSSTAPRADGSVSYPVLLQDIPDAMVLRV